MSVSCIYEEAEGNREGKIGRKTGGFTCWCEDDGRWSVAPCANLTEGITGLVNGCPSYGPG